MKGLLIGTALFVGAASGAVLVGIWGGGMSYAGEQEAAGIVVAVLAIVALAAGAGTVEEATIMWRNRRHPCTCHDRQHWWDDHQPWCRRSWR